VTGVGAPTGAQAALVGALKSEVLQADILVRSADGAVIGTVEPITGGMAGDRVLREILARWRAENMASFLTVFKSTPGKTAGYLTQVLLPAPSRLLCLLRDAEGAPVGNIGLCNIAMGSAELDNVLRGERTVPGFMRAATRAFLDWAFAKLNLREIYLHVLEDNARAVRLYESVGFRRGQRLPLWRRETEEGYDLLRAEEDGAVPVSTRLLRMTLNC
jgi:RimJ/RimL family protein N-acetyltransferase